MHLGPSGLTIEAAALGYMRQGWPGVHAGPVQAAGSELPGLPRAWP
jgi:hypothetical protein